MQNGGGRDDGNGDGFSLAGTDFRGQRAFKDEELLDRKVGCGEDAIQTFRAEEALAVQHVRDVGGTKSGLPGEQRAAEDAAVDTAQQFQAKMLVNIPKVHRRTRFQC